MARSDDSSETPADAATRESLAITPDGTDSAEDAAAERRAAFPIVGIGASAGGLEALEIFLQRMPSDSGLAFVVIQHLDPHRKGIMVELLQRSTPMPVIEVTDQTRVEANHVYLIPPNKDMAIQHGVLHLLPQGTSRGVRLPIDFFFRSLAADRGDQSLGVVLSGMGSDGTLGLRAIKEKAGACFVQALASAKFDGMPRSAIEAGLADVVAPVEELPGQIIAYTKHSLELAKPQPPLEDHHRNALEKIFTLLRLRTGNDFSLYKRSTISRRVERRMGLHHIERLTSYVEYLRENPEEVDQLFKELLIGVTSFFRDAPVWESLRDKVLPDLLAERAEAQILRAWVPACSTGEEAYTLAIIFKEAAEQLRPEKQFTLQIFATDLDKQAIEGARLGVYPANIAADVSESRLRRFFIKEDSGFRVSKEIREMVVFASQNVVLDPPFTKLDILVCRNLLIYLSSDVQKRLIPLFHYTLNPEGLLVLGTAETVGTASSELFTLLDTKARIYRRDHSVRGVQVDFPSTFRGGPLSNQTHPQFDQMKAAPVPNLQTLAEQVLLQRFAPAAVLTDHQGDILYFCGRTGKYLEPASGKAQLNVFAMAREGLRFELIASFNAARGVPGPVVSNNISVKTNGAYQAVNLTVEQLAQPVSLKGMMMVVFADTDTPEAANPADAPTRNIVAENRIRELEQQLRHAVEETQGVREEMQTSQEELKSTNEELQSTNEELQSTNEELTTSKEEMQSLNEELQTVNNELQAKVDELSRTDNDMKNLLNSTDIATLFLDRRLNVRRFTNETTRIIKLIPGDAGRPITDITTELDYSDLAEDAQKVLMSLVFSERIVASRNNRWYSVRILPYRTNDNVIDGVVITFTDVTHAKILDSDSAGQADYLKDLADAVPNLLWAARPDGDWDFLSNQWKDYTGTAQKDLFRRGWLERTFPEDRERVKANWQQAVESGERYDDEFRIRSKDGDYRWFKVSASAVRDEQRSIIRWYGSATDVNDLKGNRTETLPEKSSDGGKQASS